MTSSQKQKLALVVVCVALSLLLVSRTFFREQLPEWVPSRALKLGLDLKGGVYLDYAVQTGEAIKSQLNDIGTTLRAEMRKKRIGILRTRPEADGTLEVTLLNDRGQKEVEDFIQSEYRGELVRVEKSAKDNNVILKFAYTPRQLEAVKEQAVEGAITKIRNRVDQFGVAEPLIQRSQKERIVVQLPDVKDLEAVQKTIGSVAKLEFRIVADGKTDSLGKDTIRVKEKEGGELSVEDEVLMTGNSVETATSQPSPQSNEMEVSLKLNSTGARIFDQITADNVGRRMAIILDGVSQSAPVIRERISGGRAQITGSFSPEDAHILSVVLRAGALPAPLKPINQRLVGATLGADSIRKSVQASLLACVVVFLFTIIYYRKSGLLAVLTLTLNVLFLLALLTIFGATLTLPGIAGIALTVAMAVDANIVFFERMREEIRKGASARAAVEGGFDRAYWAVLDSNLTTLLAGLVLYAFGTGPIKGFAVTLSLGILTTLFGAIFVCRLGYDVFNMLDRDGRLSV